MNKRLFGTMTLCLLSLTACRHVEDSEIVSRFKAAGGGNPDGATTAQIKTWFAHHADFRKELTPLCTAKRKTATADWAGTDEGKVCTGLTQANFFGKPNITSDHVPF
jgi:hypothetical protein